jgi:hypothetical protein
MTIKIYPEKPLADILNEVLAEMVKLPDMPLTVDTIYEIDKQSRQVIATALGVHIMEKEYEDLRKEVVKDIAMKMVFLKGMML